MNRITLPLVAACLGLGIWAGWEHIERTKLKDRVADLEAEAIAHTEQARVERIKLTDEVAALQKKSATLEAAAEKDPDKTGTAAAKPKDPSKAMADGFAKMFSDPKMRDVMKSSARMQIDMMYRDLFDLLNLPEPQRTEFEKLINEKATAGMDAAFAMMSGEKTAEDKKAAAAEIKAKTEEVEKKIKDLLGKEDFDKVKRYEDSQMERMQLKTFTGMLTSKDLSLDEAAETKLMDAMYQEREKFPFASKYIDQQNPDITRFTPENSDRFNDEYTQLNERIAKRAEGFLSAPQLEVFRESQTQQMNMIKMHMEMGAKMFGGGKD